MNSFIVPPSKSFWSSSPHETTVYSVCPSEVKQTKIRLDNQSISDDVCKLLSGSALPLQENTLNHFAAVQREI